MAEALLMAGADVNDKDNDGWTPLHLAINSSVYIGYDNTVEVEFLLTAGADVNAVNNSGQLPLDIVIQNHLDGHNIRGTFTILTPKTASPAAQGEPMAGTSAVTIERVGERTEVRWKDGVWQFSPEADGRWRDVILDQGFSACGRKIKE